MNFSREQIAEQCRNYGAEIQPLPPLVSGPQLFWAISGVESSYGANCTPRHEPGYDQGGRYGDTAPVPELREKYGRSSACSFGPWQILLANAPTYAPEDFQDIQLAAQASVAFLNSLLRRFHPANLAQIGSCWNAGHIQSPLSADVQAYANKLESCYRQAMPVP